MFVMNVDKNIATISTTEPMTSGSVNTYLVDFYFSKEWDDLEKIAVFKSGDTVVDVILDKEEDICFMPWEVLVEHGRTVKFGVYGTKNGNVVLPTIWAETEEILEGVVTGAASQPPSPTLYEQLLAKMDALDHLGELATLSAMTTEDLEAILI